jgi:2-keto-4-pentenoate hydratase/2-oxohepta-3-ene-1,7-dioic acid hydratase in catechol pathway
MKLATFLEPNTGADQRLGIVLKEGIVDVVAAARALRLSVPAKTVTSAISSGKQTLVALAELAELAESKGMLRPAQSVILLPPVPDPGKFFCVGKNTSKHREELIQHKMMNEIPNEPTGFIKLVETIVGQDADVARPAGITTLDYEPELVFVVGKYAHGVSKADALDYIAGFTLFNDISAREIQKREVASGTRFWTAKNMPGFSPIGPHVATLDEVADLNDLWITCHVNGQQRLRENTSQYLFKIADVLEHFTRYVPFHPGDLIAMGAPKGVAFAQPNADELYLKPGDRMEIAIEGVMSLRTNIIGPDA